MCTSRTTASIGSHVTMANSCTLAGHVLVEDHATLGGFCKVHQFCRIGAYSFCGMDSGFTRDVPPYVLAAGYMAAAQRHQQRGLAASRLFSAERIRVIRNAYKLLYRSGLKLEEAIEQIGALAVAHADLERLVAFLRGSERSIIR